MSEYFDIYKIQEKVNNFFFILLKLLKPIYQHLQSFFSSYQKFYLINKNKIQLL